MTELRRKTLSSPLGNNIRNTAAMKKAFKSVLPERGSEAGAHFSKNGQERSVSGAFIYIYIYIYIYIFRRKHVECQTRCKIYEACMFVILPIYEMPSKFHIIHHSMNLK
jgi:hypothetical protein